MKLFYTTVIISVATLLLISGGSITSQLDLRFHQNSFINDMAKYQFFAVSVALLTMYIFFFLHPESKHLLRIGNLSEVAEKEKWLGVNGKSSWLSNGRQLLTFISIATGVFMFLGVKYTNSINNFQWWFIPFVLVFSLTNSFAEEMIFRFGIISGLSGHYSKITILIASGVLFGLPHYFGNPGGVTGVIMSGILGYILCKATIETKGVAIAWLIHFVQDIIIFLAVMMMNIRS